jgi:E3 ubiquitin-protein ligase BRE1
MRSWYSVSILQFHTLYDLFARDVLELNEAIKIKEAEGDAYISEIEVSSFLLC